MTFKANNGIWGTMFGIPCIVADNLLKVATGQQLKVLIYILRHSGRECTDEEITLNTGVSAKEAAEAVMFWQQLNILDPSGSSSVFSVPEAPAQTRTEAADKTSVSSENKSPEKTKKSVQTRQKQDLSASEIADLITGSADISELFKTAESILGTITHNQQNSLIWMYSYLGLKKEVIITLLAYCASIEKTNPGYVEKIAYNWSENEINTLDAAQDEVSRLTKFYDFTGKIMKSFEMKQRPTSKQSKFIDQWQNAGYSMELIHYAYEKTIERTNQLSFEYINAILLNWQNNGYTTIRHVQEAEENHKKKKSSSSQSGSDDFDVEKYKVFINNF